MPLQRICVHWPRLGPYHVARLQALHRLLAPQGVELVALETASVDAIYAWRPETDPLPFRREQAFPGRSYDDLTAAELHEGVTALLDRLQPDAVFTTSYSLPDARACLHWCRRHRRVAGFMTDTKADDAPRRPLRERLKSLIVRQFDVGLVSGTPHVAYFASLGFPPDALWTGASVVDNAAYAARADALRADRAAVAHLPGLADGRPFFLAVNRFIARKNLDGLVRAYLAYRQRVAAPWRLVLLGDGPDRAALEALAREAGTDVVFPGFLQIEDTTAYFGLAGAFVHPATADQWGLVVNEAMAAGAPVVVSRRAGCAPDLVVEGENGYTFDPGDTAHLAVLLERVAAPDADRAAMGAASRRIIAAWSPEHFAAQLWQAAQAGQARARRPYSLTGRLALAALRAVARDARTFHAISD